MKVVMNKLVLILAAICSIYSLNMRYNLRGGTSLQSLTFYQMALHATSHGNETAASNSTAGAKASNATAAVVSNTTNVVGALTTEDVIVNKPPYEITKCDQVIMLDAKRIANPDDYTSRAPAFYTMSAYLINMFESKDNNKLLESINLAHIKVLPNLLQGSKTCMLFQDGYSERNITLCLEDKPIYESIKKSYSDFMTCRMGGDLKGFDPVTINNVLTASCNGFNSTSGAKYDLPKIKEQISEELKKAGFDVKEATTGGIAKFGASNDTASASNQTLSAPPKVVDLRVPGTY